MMPPRADVAVVGFGPVGAALAGLLARRGLRVVVLDRDTEPFRLPRAAHIDHTGLRVLQELGCLDEVLPTMIPNPGLEFVTSDRKVLMRVAGDQGSRSGLPASMYFHQPRVDRAIRDAVAAMPGVDVRLATTVTGLDQLEDHVRLLVTAADGGRGVVEADWVVGCDGASSTVREGAGLKLESLDFDEEWLVVDLILRDPSVSLPAHAMHVCDPARPHTAIPMPHGRYRFELMLLDTDDRDWVHSAEGVAWLLRDWLPPDAAVTERAAIYTFHGLVAHEWRAGRVFIAGDAAHQMPPFLGQGMCSGLRDAANLAWKLAAVHDGAPEILLDSYTAERRPHVHRIVTDVVAFGEIICTLDTAVAAGRDARILADPAPATRRIPFGLPALLPGPLVLEGGGQLSLQPAARLADGRRLDDLVGARFLVLAVHDGAFGDSAAWWQGVGSLVTTLDEFDDPDGSMQAWLARLDAGVVVVRPDRYVLGAARNLDLITDQVRGLLGQELAGEPGKLAGLVQNDEVAAVGDCGEPSLR